MSNSSRATSADDLQRAGQRASRQLPWAIPIAGLLLVVGFFLYMPLFSTSAVVDDGAVAFENPGRLRR